MKNQILVGEFVLKAVWFVWNLCVLQHRIFLLRFRDNIGPLENWLGLSSDVFFSFCFCVLRVDYQVISMFKFWCLLNCVFACSCSSRVTTQH